MENNDEEIQFPKGDTEFYQWMENFLEYATQNQKALGISDEELNKVEAKLIDFYMAMREDERAREAYEESLKEVERLRPAYEKALEEKRLKDQKSS